MPRTPAPPPTFQVKFVAPGLTPEGIPLNAVTDVLAALQDLASGRDPFTTRQVPPEKTIGLLKVQRGSAFYGCVARAPEEARQNLTLVGKMLSSLEENGTEADLMVSAFRPIEKLSHVAKSLGCRLEIYPDDAKGPPIFAITGGDFEKLSGRLLLQGDTTVIGMIVRAGGATGMRCLMRVPGRRQLLYCDVENRKLVRQLGRHLYEQIAATGTAVWIHRSWHIYKFTIRGFSQPKVADSSKTLESLRNAGLKAWDEIPDPEAYIKEMRS